MRPPAFLEYKKFRYLKVATLLIVIASLAYRATQPAGGTAYGGTWFGYLLGVLSACLVLLLAWYGIRKRQTPRIRERRRGNRRRTLYAEQAGTAGRRVSDRRKTRPEDHWRYGGTLQGWLSAHAYLGGALIVIVSLHAGFRLGWNVHSLAYLLVILVVASGLYGTIAYLRYPRLITENGGDETLDGMLRKLAALDEQAHRRTVDLPEEVHALVARSRQEGLAEGRLFQQLGWSRQACPTALAVQQLQEAGKLLVDGDHPRLVRELHAVLLQKQQLLARIREEIRATAQLRLWLYAHVPLTVALLAALLAHVIAILVYW
jgi:hypothetical protein